MQPSLIISLGIAATTYLADQASKQWVLHWFEEGNQAFPLTSFLTIILTGNQGISFGLFKMESSLGVILLVGVAGILSLYLLKCLWKSRYWAIRFCYGLILGGAAGNIADRVMYKKVIDFIDFHVGGYHWYTFNIADCAIVGGAGGLLLMGLIWPSVYEK